MLYKIHSTAYLLSPNDLYFFIAYLIAPGHGKGNKLLTINRQIRSATTDLFAFIFTFHREHSNLFACRGLFAWKTTYLLLCFVVLCSLFTKMFTRYTTVSHYNLDLENILMSAITNLRLS